jgi:cytoskeleton protein RodZ
MADNENIPPEDIAPGAPDAPDAPTQPPVSAGRIIRDAREKAGITAAKLCADLRVSPATLEALESGDYGKLAGAPYVRAMLVSLSRHLRLDPKVALNAYAEEIGGQQAPAVQVSPYKDDSGTHAKAHKQIFVLLLAVLLFILLLIMGKVNTSSPETEPAETPAAEDTLLDIDPVHENDSLPVMPDSTGADSLSLPGDSGATVPAEAGQAKQEKAKAETGTHVRVEALSDSVWLRVLPAGARESSRYLRRGKSMEFSHDDAITFITRQGGAIRVFVGDSASVPAPRRFKVDGDQITF